MEEVIQNYLRTVMFRGTPCILILSVATTADSLKMYFKNKHEGLRYPCSQCKFASTRANCF